MGKSGRTFWRLAARVFLVPVFAWLLAAQSILLPLAKAQAVTLAGGDAALSILCSSTLPTSGGEGDDTEPRKVHDFGCCTLAGRLDIDLPVATLVAPMLLDAPAALVQNADYVQPQGRAPPAITATPSAPRAPPSHT